MRIKLDSGLVIITEHPEKIIQKKGKVVIKDPKAILNNVEMTKSTVLRVGRKYLRILPPL